MRPKKGWHHTDESKKKISLKNKNRHVSIESRKKMSLAKKGKPLSAEHKKNIGLANTGKHHPHSLETKRKIGLGNKGNVFSAEHIRKLCLANSGSNHYNWQGGKSFEPYGFDFNNKLKKQIKQRDNYQCQKCFKYEKELFTKKGNPSKLSIHHIDYNKKNNVPENLISLCVPCHSSINYKREDWITYFKIYTKFKNKRLCIRTVKLLKKGNLILAVKMR